MKACGRLWSQRRKRTWSAEGGGASRCRIQGLSFLWMRTEVPEMGALPRGPPPPHALLLCCAALPATAPGGPKATPTCSALASWAPPLACCSACPQRTGCSPRCWKTRSSSWQGSGPYAAMISAGATPRGHPVSSLQIQEPPALADLLRSPTACLSLFLLPTTLPLLFSQLCPFFSLPLLLGFTWFTSM